MRRFKTKKKKNIYINFILISIFLICVFLLNNYNKKISPKIIDVASTKLEEITTLYIKNNIAPITADLSKLIKITQNSKEEILMVDVDYNYAYDIMYDIVKKIQSSILELENGNISNFQNHKELQAYKKKLYLSIPLGLSDDGVLFSSIGPKIPIKISFYEHVLGTIETSISEYGINNALLKVTLTIDLEQKLILPYKSQKVYNQYTLELGSKVINGSIPNIYGGSIFQKSGTIST